MSHQFATVRASSCRPLPIGSCTLSLGASLFSTTRALWIVKIEEKFPFYPAESSSTLILFFVVYRRPLADCCFFTKERSFPAWLLLIYRAQWANQYNTHKTMWCTHNTQKACYYYDNRGERWRSACRRLHREGCTWPQVGSSLWFNDWV